nr:hypothetical protein Iba_chr09aCG10970 [Ipomoea batatas]
MHFLNKKHRRITESPKLQSNLVQNIERQNQKIASNTQFVFEDQIDFIKASSYGGC